MKRILEMMPVLLLLTFGVIVRLLPHIPNMTPVTAIAIASSVYLGKRYAILIPLTVLLLSDSFLGVYDIRIMLSVYGAFSLIAILSASLGVRNKPVSTLVPIATSAIFFFLITNAAVWLFSPWYEKTFAGLMYAYELGLPFLMNMALGDVLYSGILIGAFELSKARKETTFSKPQSVQYLVSHK